VVGGVQLAEAGARDPREVAEDQQRRLAARRIAAQSVVKKSVAWSEALRELGRGNY
jgi:hypothetical protein